MWFVNLFATGILRVLHINTKGARDQRLSTEELRTIVLESGSFMPTKHRSILLNLFDLENISVDDVMIPRRRIEALDFDAPFEQILHQLETCYHNKLVVYQGDIDRVLGVLHVRKTLAAAALTRNWSARRCASCSPSRTSCRPARRCSSNCSTSRRAATAPGAGRQRIRRAARAVTPEDIIEELIGEFTTSIPRGASSRGRLERAWRMHRGGSMPLRELNRWLHLTLSPTDGPENASMG